MHRRTWAHSSRKKGSSALPIVQCLGCSSGYLGLDPWPSGYNDLPSHSLTKAIMLRFGAIRPENHAKQVLLVATPLNNSLLGGTRNFDSASSHFQRPSTWPSSEIIGRRSWLVTPCPSEAHGKILWNSHSSGPGKALASAKSINTYDIWG